MVGVRGQSPRRRAVLEGRTLKHEGKYDTFLQVRLTTHDKERIKARAIEAGMQTSEYVRKRALGERCGPLTRDFLRRPPDTLSAR